MTARNLALEALKACTIYACAGGDGAMKNRHLAAIAALEAETGEVVAFVNEQGFIIERDDMQISSGEKLYLAAGAREGNAPSVNDSVNAAAQQLPDQVKELLCILPEITMYLSGHKHAAGVIANGISEKVGRWEFALQGFARWLREVLEAGARPVEPAPAGEHPSGAIVNGRTHIERLEATYQFECEAGPLSNCKDWQGLKRCFEYLIGRIDADRAMRAAQPAPGAGDQVQMILKHRLIRKVEGDWLAASEFMTGEPDPSWLAKTEESPEEWRIEQARRVSGEQIQAGLTRAFASWKKPAPAAVVGPVKLPFAIMDDELEALRRFDECVRDSDAGGYDVRNEMMKRLAEIGLVRRVTANIYEHTNFGLSVLNGDFDAAPTTQPAPAAQDDAKDAAITQQKGGM